MSKVKFFVCKKSGHYVGQCPNRKKKKGGTAATTKEALTFRHSFRESVPCLTCCTSVETITLYLVY
jgi:hypothetical protein